MPVSRTASRSRQSGSGMNPMVNSVMALMAKSSAALAPGKNFRAPNQQKTSPMQTRSTRVLIRV